MNIHGRDLRYFTSVAEELSFTRAAERLFISQPALSKQIRMLEKQLGAVLFERDRRTVRLTAVGKALLPHAREVLAAWQAAEAAVEEVKTAERCTLVIGMSTSPGRGLLPALRTRLVSRHPDAQPVLRQVNWADPSAGLADGSSDVAFVWLPLPDDDRYQYAVVAREPRLVALPDGHPLAARAASDPEGKVDFTDLLEEPFLALPPEAGPLRDYWLALDARDGRQPRIGGVVASAEETHEAVASGQGVALLATGNASLVVRDEVIAVPVRGISPSQLAVAAGRDDTRPLVLAYLAAAREVGATTC
ncbi:LysR family transcriptional regulator [Streptomyces avermitilis]|uniref:LysR-family transcriptional regulator n=2 Tax=Streptomyces avermitilis TaxID=33903 RepID=Q82PV1_STRAW|nr:MULTISPECIES: LysR family transcriptional regulator [Streptomyces]KUN51197.1 LysR family transcriptional regulator [Streptomyces avermitilis]MYS96416.1 LysR family transcriptional regulator [Streptomyces sp. SID5469]OOV17891.1 LysR family transcriptional regulator [Streptomyces avermitilis]BAC68481.1 putative LysR-family transcriptional regulator [Streptomyces avermitilis MA-4680 = NBRC 14893]BBJ48332.1 LysR family transcriptional regulator [Streptomyces avermitilis]